MMWLYGIHMLCSFVSVTCISIPFMGKQITNLHQLYIPSIVSHHCDEPKT